ncbi:MAG: S46 family peptidase, partial [Bacteroidota bacterium]
STTILAGTSSTQSAKARQATIDKNIDALKASVQLGAFEDAVIRPFFEGNQYFMFITATYRDVRLVGAPPSSIGKFGADTDNWEWPRHTGDFALFRIYADKNNQPAEYATDNVPYQPKHALPISLDGVEENDFTMIFGFPGRTRQYLPSFAVQQTMQVLNPAKIDVRTKTLEIIDAAMQNDPAVKIQYASKQARIANAWKKWIGESQGLEKTNALAKKRRTETEFAKRVNDNPEWKQQYGRLLKAFEQNYQELEPYALTHDYFNEIVGRNIELMRLVNTLSRVAAMDTLDASLQVRVVSYLENFYKDYRPEIDQKVFARLIETYFNEVDQAYISDSAKDDVLAANKDYTALAQNLYSNSVLTKGEQLITLLQSDPTAALKAINEDPAFLFGRSLATAYSQTAEQPYQRIKEELKTLQRTYMKALMEVFPERRFYPDANSTMRVTYGQVKGYEPRDAVRYQPVTYLSGVMEKYQPADYEFDVPMRLRKLHEFKDYGQYTDATGDVPVCFLGSNHTTGGNSGSPAIDAHGNLIGLNFDRVWEGTMSDLNYDASICRNIMVDVRYILFIVDKYAGATHLIDEMELVRPKRDKKNFESAPQNQGKVKRMKKRKLKKRG